MSKDEDVKKAMVIVVTRVSKELSKKGASVYLPNHIASGVADQIFFAVEVIKSGANITPAKLSVLLASKGLGVFKLASEGGFDCGIKIATVLLGIAKFAVSPVGTPAAVMATAVSLLYDCYSADKSCGISAAVQAEINRRMLPIAVFLDNGVREVMSRQSF